MQAESLSNGIVNNVSDFHSHYERLTTTVPNSEMTLLGRKMYVWLTRKRTSLLPKYSKQYRRKKAPKIFGEYIFAVVCKPHEVRLTNGWTFIITQLTKKNMF